MAESSSSTVLAVGIAVGGACIGAGLYFGLRARAPEPSGASLAAPTTTVASATTRAADGVHGAEPAALPGVDVAAARGEVVRQLEAVRASLRDECWAPSVARTPAPDHGSFTFQYTFDATGKQIARGIAADEGRARGDVAFCLTGKVPNVAISPQGASVRVSLSFAFP